jgi:hypothetical protein
MRMAAGCGRMRMNRAAPYFDLLYPARKMSLRIESRAQEPFQQLVINWFPKITDDSFLRKARGRLVIRIEL